MESLANAKWNLNLSFREAMILFVLRRFYKYMRGERVSAGLPSVCQRLSLCLVCELSVGTHPVCGWTGGCERLSARV